MEVNEYGGEVEEGKKINAKKRGGGIESKRVEQYTPLVSNL